MSPPPRRRFSLEELFRAGHQHELRPDGLLHLHLDHRHMGVGGDDSWSPSVHQQFTVPPQRYAFHLTLAPCCAAADAAAAWGVAQVRGMTCICKVPVDREY